MDEPATEPAVAPLADPNRMPRWVPRAIVLFWIGFIAVSAAGWLLGQLRSLIVALLVSLFLALAIEPAVDWLATRGWRRGAATGLVFVVLITVGSVFVTSIGALVVDQVSNFIDDAPGYVEDAVDWVNDTFGTEIKADELNDELTKEDGPVRRLAEDLADNALSLSATVLTGIFSVFMIGLFTFYLVADGPRLRRSVCRRLRPDRQRIVLETWELAIRKVGSYLYARVLLAAISATVSWIAYSIIDLPYALALALWTGVIAQFVPMIGTYLAGALPVAVGLIDQPIEGLWTLLFILAYQQIENVTLEPKISGRTMQLHPAIAFGSVLAGAAILGPVGAVLALPFAAVFQAFFSAYVQTHDVVESSLTEVPPRRPWWRRRKRDKSQG